MFMWLTDLYTVCGVQVLAAVVDEVIPLDADTSTILQDTLSILSSKVQLINSLVQISYTNKDFHSLKIFRFKSVKI